ncbi:trypsin-like peptidase domain-containing protein [Streptomyces sp. CA-288835]|uniref:trypsin-like peptidase domain-containing protein n=1 Tax=Streptomyces sp. CA-288835 TaxID=3240069 RepID=UPI003D8DE1F4
MTSASWHARISCGRDTGAGFLVTERHVLTCAHVVARSRTDTVTVSFAHGTEGQVPARVIAQGGWDGGKTDPGDLAVHRCSAGSTPGPGTSPSSCRIPTACSGPWTIWAPRHRARC